MKFEISKIKRLARMCIFVFILILIGSVFFLYRYFYQTLTQAQVVILLKSQVSPDVLNIQMWQRVKDGLNYKKTPPTDIKNLPSSPFDPIEFNAP